MKEIRKDILGKTPKIGDLIVFNPPRYKGLHYSYIVGFSKAGLPVVEKCPYTLKRVPTVDSFVIVNNPTSD